MDRIYNNIHIVNNYHESTHNSEADINKLS